MPGESSSKESPRFSTVLSGLIPTCTSMVKLGRKCLNPACLKALKAGKLVSAGLYIDEGRRRPLERAA